MIIIMAYLFKNNIQRLNHARQYTGYKEIFFFLKLPILLPVMPDLLKEINLSKESL